VQEVASSILESPLCKLKDTPLLSCLRHRKFTLLQASMLLREVLSAKFEVGFRHARVPLVQLRHWDKWLSSSLLQLADLAGSKIHSSSVATILSVQTMEDAYLAAKTVHIMEMCTKSSEMQSYYQHEMDEALHDLGQALPARHPDLADTLQRLQDTNIAITKNPSFTHDPEPVAKGSSSVDSAVFNGSTIPLRDSLRLWGADFQCPPDVTVTICTDGSTYQGKPSGAALVYATDDLKAREFWPHHLAWNTLASNNYVAEIAAIHRAIRSVPITVPIHIHTDSYSSIQAIEKYLPTTHRHYILSYTAQHGHTPGPSLRPSESVPQLAPPPLCPMSSPTLANGISHPLVTQRRIAAQSWPLRPPSPTTAPTRKKSSSATSWHMSPVLCPPNLARTGRT
jgi:hypothetical protein